MKNRKKNIFLVNNSKKWRKFFSFFCTFKHGWKQLKNKNKMAGIEEYSLFAPHRALLYSTPDRFRPNLSPLGLSWAAGKRQRRTLDKYSLKLLGLCRRLVPFFKTLREPWLCLAAPTQRNVGVLSLTAVLQCGLGAGTLLAKFGNWRSFTKVENVRLQVPARFCSARLAAVTS